MILKIVSAKHQPFLPLPQCVDYVLAELGCLQYLNLGDAIVYHAALNSHVCQSLALWNSLYPGCLYIGMMTTTTMKDQLMTSVFMKCSLLLWFDVHSGIKQGFIHDWLSHYGLVMPYGDIDFD